jgi:hypothetical protein
LMPKSVLSSLPPQSPSIRPGGRPDARTPTPPALVRLSVSLLSCLSKPKSIRNGNGKTNGGESYLLADIAGHLLTLQAKPIPAFQPMSAQFAKGAAKQYSDSQWGRCAVRFDVEVLATFCPVCRYARQHAPLKHSDDDLVRSECDCGAACRRACRFIGSAPFVRVAV